jgi:hypothetical protein
MEKADGRWLAFVVSHPSDKNKNVRWMGHPAGLAKIRLIAAKRPGDDRGVSFR